MEKQKYLIETFKLTNESCDFGIQRKLQVTESENDVGDKNMFENGTTRDMFGELFLV